MAFRVICDGCGVEIPEDTPEQGFVRPTQYCAACLPDYAAFAAERDKLHEHAARVWTEGLAVVVEAWRAKHPNGRLPDGIA